MRAFFFPLYVSILLSPFILYMFSDSFFSSSFYLRKSLFTSIFSLRYKRSFFSYILSSFLYIIMIMSLSLYHYHWLFQHLFFLSHSLFHLFLPFFFIIFINFLIFHLSSLFLFSSSCSFPFYATNIFHTRYHHHRLCLIVAVIDFFSDWLQT